MIHNALALSGLGVAYGDHVALRDVTCAIGWGELVGVVGPNGAGKSSMFRAICGLIPHSGTVVVDGQHCDHRHDRAGAGFIPQRSDIDPEFPITLSELVLTGRRRFRRSWRRPTADDRAATARAIDRVGLTGRERDPIGSLSGGQLQRGMLARALAQGADLLLLDEALSGVDAPTTSELFDLFGDLTEHGATILVATHDLALARHRFSRCLGINGTLVADGPPADVLDGPTLESVFGSRAIVSGP
jgi:ABC-type Mn2+/Zn2+ transport system ATPase subunit